MAKEQKPQAPESPGTPGSATPAPVPPPPFGCIAVARHRLQIALPGRTLAMRGGDILTGAGNVALARQAPASFDFFDLHAADDLDKTRALIEQKRKELAEQAKALGFRLELDI